MFPFWSVRRRALYGAMVFFMKEKMNSRLEKLLLGFASGVMIAASVWSLLDPAIEMTRQQGGQPWLPVAVGFLLGIGFLLALDCAVPHLHPEGGKPEGVKSGFDKATMLMLAVSLIQRRGSVRERLAERPLALRWAVFGALLLAVVVFGAYGIGFDANQFIYNQF